jgi:hypothetical protein
VETRGDSARQVKDNESGAQSSLKDKLDDVRRREQLDKRSGLLPCRFGTRRSEGVRRQEQKGADASI